MQTKEHVLQILEDNKGRSISGAAIAEALSLSRAAVWKAIKELRQSGYPIDAATNRGYCLRPESDVLSPQGIARYFKEFLDPSASAMALELPSPQLHVYSLLDSTNQEAKRLAADGAPHATVIVAEEQSAGRGRLGRSFFSPKGCGIYISLLLKPAELGLSTSDLTLLTTAASVAVASAVEDVLEKKLQIKWVNDLYFHGKKVCGILTEGIASLETGTVDSVILGVGLNYKQPPEGYPEDIASVATALLTSAEAEAHPCKNQLTAAVCCRLLSTLSSAADRRFLSAYKERSLLLGKPIRIIRGHSQQDAIALDIVENGGLLVRLSDDGSETVLTTGEVSIRPADGKTF